MVVRKALRQQMHDFTCERIEAVGKYSIIGDSIDHIVCEPKLEYEGVEREGKKVILHRKPVYIVLHGKQFTVDEYQEMVKEQGMKVSDIFYKDGVNFSVRLGWRGNLKFRRSLKRYTKEQIDSMIHARDLELAAMDRQPGPRFLDYYQPETERLEESIRKFRAEPAILDYAHLPREDGIHNCISKEYWKMTEILS